MPALQESCRCINGRGKYLLRGMHVFVGDCLKILVRLVVVKGWGWGLERGGWQKGFAVFVWPRVAIYRQMFSVAAAPQFGGR